MLASRVRQAAGSGALIDHLQAVDVPTPGRIGWRNEIESADDVEFRGYGMVVRQHAYELPAVGQCLLIRVLDHRVQPWTGAAVRRDRHVDWIGSFRIDLGAAPPAPTVSEAPPAAPIQLSVWGKPKRGAETKLADALAGSNWAGNHLWNTSLDLARIGRW